MAAPVANKTGARFPAAAALLIALAAIITRAPVFGDPYYHNDELLYWLVGQRMHEGALPYVDIWDRKGPGLFLTYGLIASFGRAVLVYQIAATLAAGLTAWLVFRMAGRMTGQLGATLAAMLYLVILPLFSGQGGQAPVFYNLFVALAVWLVLGQLAELRAGRIGRAVPLAMLSAGFAVTFKQTALFEGAFLGLFVLWMLHRAGMPPGRLLRTGSILALAGSAPMLAFAALYAALGHFAEFWHAMVTANLAKPVNPAGDAVKRLRSFAIIASPLLLPAIATLLLPRLTAQRPGLHPFLTGWLIAALIGLASVPNFIDHYMLPMVLTLAVIAAPALGSGLIAPTWAVISGLAITFAGPTFRLEARQESRASFAALVAAIQQRDPQPRLLVYQGPTSLYLAFRQVPPSALVFPTHLFHAPERNTSHLETAAEMRRVLAWRPSVVVTYPDFPPEFLNRETAAMVAGYVRSCPGQFDYTVTDYYGRQKVRVFTGCAATRTAPPR